MSACDTYIHRSYEAREHSPIHRENETASLNLCSLSGGYRISSGIRCVEHEGVVLPQKRSIPNINSARWSYEINERAEGGFLFKSQNLRSRQ